MISLIAILTAITQMRDPPALLTPTFERKLIAAYLCHHDRMCVRLAEPSLRGSLSSYLHMLMIFAH